MEMIRPTDSDLLARFAAHRDEDAFSELMRRHGSMVHSVSSRILSSADADDATQAVFLTLAHKAADLRREESLAAWLHRVAVRVSLDLRKSAAARQRREQHVAALRETFPVQSSEDRELFAQLDAELDQLPEKYRAPLVLHHLQGLTQDETAQRLKRKAGTISMQLNRARDMLRQRLERRNTATVGTAMALLLAAKAHAAEVPAALAKSTLTNASLVAAGNTAATGSVAALTQGALSMLFVEKVKAVALVALTATVFLGASGTLAYRAFAEESPPKPDVVDAQPKPKADPVVAGNPPAPKQNKEIDAKLDRNLGRLDFNDTDFDLVLEDLANRTGVKFVVAPDTGMHHTISVHGDEISARNIIDMMVKTYPGLTYKVTADAVEFSVVKKENAGAQNIIAHGELNRVARLSTTTRSENGKSQVEVKNGDTVVATRDYNQDVSVSTQTSAANGAVKQEVTIKDGSGKVLEVIKL